MNMILSDEQMLAVKCEGGHRTLRFEFVDLPVGPQPLPEWAKGLAVDFMDRYANPPRFMLKTDRDLYPRNVRYRKDGPLYIAVSDDGLAHALYHSGPLSMRKIKRWRSPDGSLHRFGQMIQPGGALDGGEWVEVDRLCSTEQAGFGGDHFDLILEDGTEVTLRGPWHGPCPQGFIELAYIDANYYCRHTKPNSRWWRPWHQYGGISGMLTQEAFIPIFARFLPHLRLARVTEEGRSLLQPLKPEWNAPKAWQR